MLDEFKTWLKSALQGWVVGTVGAAIAFVAGFTWWPELWAWLQSGGEPYRVAFLLTILMVWLLRVAPLRPLPIEVDPVDLPGELAMLTVRNRGRSGSFYASIDVLATNGTFHNFRRVSLLPTWGIGMRGGGLTSREIKRNQTGDLHLAWLKSYVPEYAHQRTIVELRMADYEHPGLCLRSEDKFSADVDLRVTISREESNSFLRAMPFPRSFVGFFTVEGREAGLAVKPTPRTVRRTTRR